MNKQVAEVKEKKKNQKKERESFVKELKRHSSKKKYDNVKTETEDKINAIEYYNSLSDAQKHEFDLELQRKKIRDNYATYLKYIYGENYVLTKFHAVLCSIAQDMVKKIEQGKQVRVLLSVPSQFGKSITLTEALPSWFLMRNPDLSCIITAYNADIAEKFGDRNRQKIKKVGKEIFGVEISDSQDNKTLFQIKNHLGQCVSTGILGALTSNPSALTIIDDPFKNGLEAENPEIRDKVYETYRDSIITRTRSMGGGILVIHTRWHEDDLIGRLMKEEGWIYINFPCVWEKGVDKLLGRRVGEVLCPELGHTVEWAEMMRKSMGARKWYALMQGKPYIDGGNIVQRKDIKFYNSKNIPPVFEELSLSCDLSFGGTKTNNDPCCLTIWGRLGANHYLLKIINKKMTFTQTLDTIQSLCAMYPMMRRKIIEKKANGNATIELLNQKIGGFIAFDPKSDSKETRFRLVAPYFESGNIFFPSEEIESNIEEYVDQVLRFPSVTHDDFVDTISQYLLNYSYKNENGRIGTDSRYADFSKAIRGFRV